MNVLLTGGAGYIGSHAALSLLDRGHNVHIIDNLSTGSEILIPKNAKFTNCNINNEIKISNLIKSDKFDLLMLVLFKLKNRFRNLKNILRTIPIMPLSFLILVKIMV